MKLGISNLKNEKSDKETLAIVSIYDRDGIIDEYLIFYLASLRVIADCLIVAVNGELTQGGREKLMTVADEIYLRPNTGFDFGAYKDVIENYLRAEELKHYNKVILCNDTCYGPFVSFENIFVQMRERDVEFWSINYIEDPLLPHFQSYFMVFGGSAIGLLMDFLENEVDSGTVNPIQVCGYEHGLSEIILSSRIRTDYYTSDVKEYHDLDIFGAPDYALELLGFPLLKRRAFSDKLSVKNNCRRALQMVVQWGNYPVDYILNNANRIYHKDFSEALQKQYITEICYFEKNYTTREEVTAFCRKHKKVYLYGNGYMSVLFMARFQRYMNAFGGYVVSDEYYKETQDQKGQVYRLSQIDLEAPLIVAMTEKVATQIADKVKERKNALFLSIDPERMKYVEERKSK